MITANMIGSNGIFFVSTMHVECGCLLQIL